MLEETTEADEIMEEVQACKIAHPAIPVRLCGYKAQQSVEADGPGLYMEVGWEGGLAAWLGRRTGSVATWLPDRYIDLRGHAVASLVVASTSVRQTKGCTGQCGL